MGPLLASPVDGVVEHDGRLVQTAWQSRGKLVHDVKAGTSSLVLFCGLPQQLKAYVLLFTSMVCSMPARALRPQIL